MGYWLLTCIFCAVFIALRLFAARRLGRISPVSNILFVIAALLALVLPVLAARGVVQVGFPGLLAFASMQLLVAGLMLWRAPVSERLSELMHPIVLEVGLILIGVICAFIALETPSNAGGLFGIAQNSLMIELIHLSSVLLALYLVFGRNGEAPAFAIMFFALFGLAEKFVMDFKNSAILPSDFLSIKTAASVAGGYVYQLNGECIFALCVAAFGCIAVLLIPRKPFGLRSTLLSAICGLMVALVGFQVWNTGDFTKSPGVHIDLWYSMNTYRDNGIVTSFLTIAQESRVTRPDGYDPEETDAMVKTLAERFERKRDEGDASGVSEPAGGRSLPSIVCIMNESYADLSIFEGMHAGYGGPRFFNDIEDMLQQGTMYVSVKGGGTCSVEFEFPTGCWLSCVPPGAYPYVSYNLFGVSNLVRQLGDLGYRTSAIHPNHATNWNRNIAYRQLGFERFYSIDDFDGDTELMRDLVSDSASYDKVCDLLQASDEPQFIFDVTMQNHSGYETGLLPESQLMSYPIDGENAPLVDEYLSIIEQSDQALMGLIERLRAMDEPVVLVFFGDHQPYFVDTFNDAWFADEDELEHLLRVHQSKYAIWANHPVDTTETGIMKDTSVNYLASDMLDFAGIPLSDYQKAEQEIAHDLPVISGIGLQDATGAWYGFESDEVSDAAVHARSIWDLYHRIQYRKVFDW